MNNAEIIQDFTTKGIWAFEFMGFICRTVSANDDDCRRDDVEVWNGKQWVCVVVASINWETELPPVLEYRARVKAWRPEMLAA